MNRSQPIVSSAQLGALLQGARKSRRLTQAQLGVRLGLSQRRISELERAPGTLSVDQLLGFLQQLGLQLSVQPGMNAPTDDAAAGGTDADTPRAPETPASDW